MSTFNDMLNIFVSTLQVDWQCPNIYNVLFDKQSQSIGLPTLSVKEMVQILARVTSDKLNFYHDTIKQFIDNTAKYKIYFNFPEKQIVNKSVIDGNKTVLKKLLKEKGLTDKVINNLIDFDLLTEKQIFEKFHQIVDNDEKKADIIESLFSCYLYNLYPEKTIHRYNTNSSDDTDNFYGFLRKHFPHKYERTHTLSVLNVTDDFYHSFTSYNNFLSSVCAFVKEQYSQLQNYCYLGLIVDSIEENGISIQWKFYSDIVLYAEKYIEEKLNIGYFHPSKIEDQTKSYIKNIDVESAKFDICNSGFTYKDCFVIADKNHSLSEKEIYSGYRILILFQKNERDEEIIPCPKCRSYNVRGNSYPIIGVKSFECNNPLCADKSKYNRGKRYSLSQIIKQEAISDVRNEIDRQTINDWRLDVVSYKTDDEIISYLIKEYTFFDDTVYLYNLTFEQANLCGRKLAIQDYTYKPDLSLLSFFDSAYFHRFMINKDCDSQELHNKSKLKNHVVYNADCLHVLSSLKENTVDGSVTSPPYYNAKDYSHWNNIYCYLYDMYNHARYLYKIMKPGSYYLYNIFDYFDNENNVVFSLMGKKRMILGAYIIYMFQKIGFEICQNIIWYKGHIQGNRATNQGNNSPYYQLPLNCYEHVFCFRKPSDDKVRLNFPQIINVFPVVKIIKGVNVLGHTAPYPLEIPDLLTSRISGVVVDSYSGSFTTARSADNNNVKSISIEQSEEYCKLGMSLLEETAKSNKNRQLNINSLYPCHPI